MSMPAAAELFEDLRRLQLLEPSQLDELQRTLLERFADPKALAAEMLRRGWLTAYQVNRIVQGRARELVLGPHVLLDRLGEGGMGVVYRARHHKLDRICALKLIRNVALAGPEMRELFQREARLAAGLNHPNIVHVYEVGEQGGVPSWPRHAPKSRTWWSTTILYHRPIWASPCTTTWRQSV
jgi:serine/threonine-protein kinase